MVYEEKLILRKKLSFMSLRSNILWIQSSLKKKKTKTEQYDKIFLALTHEVSGTFDLYFSKFISLRWL